MIKLLNIRNQSSLIKNNYVALWQKKMQIPVSNMDFTIIMILLLTLNGTGVTFVKDLCQ